MNNPFDVVKRDAQIDYNKLRHLRRNHRLFFAILGLSALLWIGPVLLLMMLPDRFQRAFGTISMVGFVGTASMMILAFPLFRTRCPRCANPFYASEGARGFFQKTNLLTRACVHCGLPLAASHEDFDPGVSPGDSRARPVGHSGATDVPPSVR